MHTTNPTSGRVWAYAGTALGGLVSIGANTAHSFVPPAGAAPGWQPPMGAVIGAVFWPIALFFAIEILARISWPAGKRWIAIRFVGLVPVAVVAAIVSYNHLSGLLAHYGEDRLTVVIGPLAVDGLMVMSASALMATSPQRSETAPATVTETVPEPAPERPLEPPAETTPEPAPDQQADPPSKPRSRAGRKTARKTAAPRLSGEALLEAAIALNATAVETTGEPVSLRKLRTEFRIGHPAAVKLRDTVIVTALENTGPAPVEHANGTALREATS